jgi:glycosyltransferase involved in cell wall biosynthesis
VDVVIPAHDEEKIIGRTIERIIGTKSIRISIVANGCSDATAEAARSAGGPDALVLETPRGGKAWALNLGDARCTGFPRAYVDADVDLDGSGLVALGLAAAQAGVLLAVPELRLVDDRSSALTRSYLRVWRTLPAVREGGAGRGVYVLSESGHAKVFPLPEDLIADDGYVDRVVGKSGRVVVAGVVATLHAPRDLRSLVVRRVRVIAGNRQLRQLGVVPPGDGDSGLGTLLRLVRERQVGMVDAVVFTAVTLTVRWLDLFRRLRRREVVWGTDLSSR